IKDAIERLQEYYKNNPEERRKYKRDADGHKAGEEMSDNAMIAEDLGLKEKLVKCVKEQSDLAIVRHLDDENTSVDEVQEKRNSQEYKSVYIVCDVATQQFIEMITQSEFDELKVDSDDIDILYGGREYRYRPSKGSSESKSLYVLKCDCGIRIQQLNPNTVLKYLKEKQKKRKFRKVYDINSIGDIKIRHNGTYELAVTCYYPQIDASNFVPAPPLFGGVVEIKEVLKAWGKENRSADFFIIETMKKLRPKRSEINTGNTNKEIRQYVEERLTKVYPQLKNDEYSNLLDRFVNTYVSYAWLYQVTNIGGEQDICNTFALQDYRIAIFTFLEEIFSWSFRHNGGDSSSKEAYEFLLKKAKYNDELGGDMIKDIAAEIGFASSDLSDISAKADSVEYLFEHDDYQEGKWSPLLCGLLIKAYVDKDHPLREVAELYPKFLSMVERAHNNRNFSKHGSKDSRYKADFDDLYFKAIDAFNILVLKPTNEKEMPKASELKDFHDMQESFNEAYSGAVKRLENENIVKVENEDAYNRLICEGVSFNYQDCEYAAKLSNLHDELLFQLINELSGNELLEEGVEDKYKSS
ncbi:MAG: hypothetical protein K2K24_02625, partial [Clostridia bacterium]|nr:hypothetical protein [Clostridia bacterium]